MIQPIRDFISVSLNKTEEKTPSGLIIKPATSEEKIATATVVAVGDGHMTTAGSIAPLVVKVGDVVLFNRQMGQEVKDGDMTLFLLREDNVMCIVK